MLPDAGRGSRSGRDPLPNLRLLEVKFHHIDYIRDARLFPKYPESGSSTGKASSAIRILRSFIFLDGGINGAHAPLHRAVALRAEHRKIDVHILQPLQAPKLVHAEMLTVRPAPCNSSISPSFNCWKETLPCWFTKPTIYFCRSFMSSTQVMIPYPALMYGI